MRGKAPAALALALVIGVACWEAALAILAPHLVPSEADYQAAAAAVRTEFRPGDLIACAPPWIGPLVRQQLGDLMPVEMVGRPDARAYGRIWEVSIRGDRAEDTAGLVADQTRRFGLVRLTRYEQQPATVSYDLVAHYPSARVSQVPTGATAPAALPCPWAGPLPSSLPSGRPAPGEAGAFRCAVSRIERRVMEIDYRPRYGIVVPAETGRRTVLEFPDVSAADLAGARLVLWFGLHDYYARKTESGPVDVAVDFGASLGRVVAQVTAEGGWQQVVVPVPAALGQGGAQTAMIRVEVSARNAQARLLGLAGQVRK